jgi:spermidine/putrescine transport system ATP-binding protein
VTQPRASSAAPAIELCGVTKRFGNHAAVDRVSLSIKQGEFFSLLGPSGCGKTTTLRMVAGFAYPDEGDIRIAGQVVNDVPAYRRDTNLVFQQLALFPHLDVFDNIAFGLRVKRKLSRSDINERVRAVLQLVELGGFETRRIKQLSGGQQQRVAIARALVNEPAVLLLDEPLGSLDLKLRLQMQLELKAIQQRVGITFLFVTHDQGEALTMSDRIAVMNEGRVEQVGSSEEIYSRPMTRFVANFIGDTNLLDTTLVGLDGANVVVVDWRGLRIRASGFERPPADSVAISVRPENIRLYIPMPEAGNDNGGDDDDNVFGAHVARVTFTGAFLRYDLVLPNSLRLTAQVPNISGRRWSEGDAVQVRWSKDSCVLLHDQGSG